MRKSFIAIVLALALMVGLVPTAVFAGNGLDTNGAHYNLNLIGVSNPKTADMTGANGHVIFVNLSGSSRIDLQEGDFQVIDANGTGSGNDAIFQLPNPDPDNTGTTTYSVYFRVLGTPNGSGTLTTEITDTNGETWLQSNYYVTVGSHNGKSTFSNVTKELLYFYGTLPGQTTVSRIPLFGNSAYDYSWEYDNSGTRLVQLRFYEVPYTVPAP